MEAGSCPTPFLGVKDKPLRNVYTSVQIILGKFQIFLGRMAAGFGPPKRRYQKDKKYRGTAAGTVCPLLVNVHGASNRTQSKRIKPFWAPHGSETPAQRVVPPISVLTSSPDSIYMEEKSQLDGVSLYRAS